MSRTATCFCKEPASARCEKCESLVCPRHSYRDGEHTLCPTHAETARDGLQAAVAAERNERRMRALDEARKADPHAAAVERECRYVVACFVSAMQKAHHPGTIPIWRSRWGPYGALPPTSADRPTWRGWVCGPATTVASYDEFRGGREDIIVTTDPTFFTIPILPEKRRYLRTGPSDEIDQSDLNGVRDSGTGLLPWTSIVKTLRLIADIQGVKVPRI